MTLRDEMDVDPVERGGRDEWGACCWFASTRICRCAAPALVTATPAVRVGQAPPERPLFTRRRAHRLHGGRR